MDGYEVIVPGLPGTYREGLTLPWAKVIAQEAANEHAAPAVITLWYLTVMVIQPEVSK